jgi:predicted aspartyl protease
MDIKAWSIAVTGATIICGAIAYLVVAQPFSRSPIDNPQPLSTDLPKDKEVSTSIPQAPEKIDRPAQLERDKLGRSLLQSMLKCVSNRVPQAYKQPPEAIQVASMHCFMTVVVLDPKGKVRADSEERLNAVVKASGIKVDPPKSNGQASVPLQQLTGSSVFTVPVAIAGKPQPFLLDTGASSSIIDTETAKQLGIKGTKFPNELMKYFVVGDDCSNVNASMHILPTLGVDRATVSGLSGMGLSRTAIPGKLSGVLGMDFLSGFDVEIDPKRKALKLLPRSGKQSKAFDPKSPSSDSAIPLFGKMGVMTAQVHVNRMPFTFALDTGADVMVVSRRTAEKLALDANSTEEIEVQGFCGREKGKKSILQSFEMGGHQAQQMDVIILNNDLLDLLGVDGIVGQSFLNQYQQYWRFGDRGVLGFPTQGSLVLTKLPSTSTPKQKL